MRQVAFVCVALIMSDPLGRKSPVDIYLPAQELGLAAWPDAHCWTWRWQWRRGVSDGAPTERLRKVKITTKSLKETTLFFKDFVLTMGSTSLYKYHWRCITYSVLGRSWFWCLFKCFLLCAGFRNTNTTMENFRCQVFGVEIPEGAETSIQERAYTSPIWFNSK